MGAHSTRSAPVDLGLPWELFGRDVDTPRTKNQKDAMRGKEKNMRQKEKNLKDAMKFAKELENEKNSQEASLS